jgi:taurine dioxygenase
MVDMPEFHAITPTIGAEVHGVDLSRPIDDALFASLHAGLLAHQVLVFREQHIAPADHLALAERFGTPVAHPAYPTLPGFPSINILESSRDKPTKIDSWHTDMTFLECPPLGSILRAIEVPETGGDTMFASLHAAWLGLSDRMRRYLDGLEATHSFAHGFRHSLAEPGGPERLAGAVRANPPRRHPVVRTHPESGRSCLFVNRLFTTGLVDIDEHESDAVLGFLYAQLETPEHCFRLRWRPGTIAFWDNRATLHRPVNDYFPATRIMQRITIAGDRPR